MAHHIAVVNHSPQLMRLFQAALTTRGYGVSLHDETDAGLDELLTLRPDLIILGNNRTFDKDDLAFFREIRRNGATASTPVLFASTVQSKADATLPLIGEAGVYFLPKPFDYQMLLECVEQALDGRSQ